MHRQEALQIW